MIAMTNPGKGLTRRRSSFCFKLARIGQTIFTKWRSTPLFLNFGVCHVVVVCRVGSIRKLFDIILLQHQQRKFFVILWGAYDVPSPNKRILGFYLAQLIYS